MKRTHVHLASGRFGEVGVKSGAAHFSEYVCTFSNDADTQAYGETALFLSTSMCARPWQVCLLAMLQKSGFTPYRTGGIEFFVSPNGVILTKGDSSGSLPRRYFARVVDKEDRPVSEPVTIVP